MNLSRDRVRAAARLFGLGVFLGASAAHAQVTGPVGSGAPFTNYQPALAVSQVVELTGLFPSTVSGEATNGTLGFVYSFAGSFAPRGSAFATGSSLFINGNAAIFALLGTTYGGDGQTRFRLPDLAGRSVVGTGEAPGLLDRDLGESYGFPQVALTTSILPEHVHTLPGGHVTGTAGGSQPFSNAQPSLALTRLIAVGGPFPPTAGGSAPAFLGQVATFAGNFAPAGWMEAHGQTLQIDQYSSLFTLLGTTFGGDGVTTFALPDLRGRVSVGAATPADLGSMTGTEFPTLSPGQLPAHAHTLDGGGSTGVTGAGVPFDNRQPSLALNYLIALNGAFPSPASGDGFDIDFPTIGQITEFAGNFAPAGWAFAHGQLLQISEYETLFQLIGTTFGGDGEATFALPDLRGRTLIGAGLSSSMGLQFRLGDTVGTGEVFLTTANLPAHIHTAVVPEPATWITLFAGLAGVGFAVRRRAG